MIVCIFKAYMVKIRLFPLHSERGFAPFYPDIGSHIHNLLKTLNPGHSSLELLRKLDNPADGCQKSGHVHGIATRSPGAIFPLIMKRPPATITSTYIRPSKERVVI